jgi:hypothetical protein
LSPWFRATLEREPTDLTYRRPPKVPLSAQRRIVDEAIDQARRAGGLRLPDRFTVKFIEGEGGQACEHDDGSYSITLGVDVMPVRLRETTLHELMHIHDFVTGTRARITRVESELRALRFASKWLYAYGRP